jgi:Bacterial Ig-like domain (group 1)
MNVKRLLTLLQFVALLAFAACGGSGSDAGAPPFGGGDGGGSGGGSTAVADLTVSLDKLSVTNSGTETVAVTVTAVDASRNALPSVPVSVSADNNAVVLPSGNATGPNGTYTAVVNIGSDRTNRVITVRAVSGALERIAAFQVVGAKLVGTALPAVVISGSANNKVDFRLTDANNNAMPGLPISVEASGLPTATGTTGANGDYSFSYTAPASAGAVTVTARAGGTSVDTRIEVQSAGGGGIPVVTQTILSASVTANPSVVAVNEGTSTTNRSEIRALFLGANNAPIQNVRVKFDLNGDANSIGGTLSSGASRVYSDANGVANVSYAPGSRSSPTDGLTIRACYGNNDAEADACSRFALTTLTVTSEPLAVSIGFNNEIESGTGGLTYIKKFVILVVDASGRAKPDVQITPSIDLVEYFKGSLVRNSSGSLGQGITAVCQNEDTNRNGVLEALEDINSNGRLDPRKSDVAITILGNGKTSANGTAVVQIEYPESVGLWLRYRILVSASGIAGTEGRAELVDVLGVAQSDLTGTATPAFFFSPYGTAASCANPN